MPARRLASSRSIATPRSYATPRAVASNRAFAGIDYFRKVLSIAPDNLIGYWPMDEDSGSVAIDYSGRDNDGAYTAVALGQTGIGDRRTCPLFDGISSINTVYSAGLVSDFNGDEGTAAAWIRMISAAPWTDSTNRWAFTIFADGSNSIYLYKGSADNSFNFWREAANVLDFVSTIISTTDWFHAAITWSIAEDEVIAYINGNQVGSIQTGLQPFVGSPISTHFNIGALATTPTSVTEGYVAHPGLWTTPLPAPQIAALAVP